MSKVFDHENQILFRCPPEMAERLHLLLDAEDGEDFLDITPMIVPNPSGEDVTQFK